MSAETSTRRRQMYRVAGALGIAGATVATITGCGGKEITGLAQAGNLNVIFLSAATVDTLTDKGYTIAVAPVCSVTDTTDYTCTGKTGDGQDIGVTTSNVTKVDADYTISVGGKQVYTGNLLNDLDENMLVKK